MDAIKGSIDSYSADFESIGNDIISGAEEGFKEGLKEGMKKGFVDGIKDCLKLGLFDTRRYEVKSFRKIVVDAFGSASKNSMRSFIKKIVKREYAAVVEPSFKKYMETACNNVVEIIKNTKVKLDSSDANALKDFLDLSTKKLNKKFGEISSRFRENFPTDIVFGSAIDGIQEDFEDTLNENIGTCKERISTEIDKKTISIPGRIWKT
jgi:hypothetical protein